MLPTHQSSFSNKVGLKVIGIIKLVSATLLLALAFGIFKMLGRDVGSILEYYVRHLHLDIENKFITRMIANASGISSKELRRAGTIALIFCVLYAVEGVGLLLKKPWAEYLTVIVTGLLIPLEVYEVALKLTPIRIIVLGVNIAIVVYLIYRLHINKRR